MSSPTLLSIAGFDPSSGAGFTADLQVFAAHGFFGIAAQTALTVQSTRGVRAAHATPADQLNAQLDCLAEDLPASGVKLGMLGSEANVHAVSAFLRTLKATQAEVPVVLDPVLVASSGAVLLPPAAVAELRDRLLPLVQVVTPNRAELAALTGLPTGTLSEVEHAARRLAGSCPGLAVVATGGDHDPPADLLLSQDGEAHWLQGTHVESRSTHGTGCAFSSALLCGLARGEPLLEAARRAKHYVVQAIRSAEPRGGGRGPMNLLWPLQPST